MMLVTPPQIQLLQAAAGNPVLRRCSAGIKNAVSEYGISFAGALSL
jgi:hypothetical protein